MNTYSIEQISIGQSERFSVAITEELIGQFTLMTGDVNPLHCDETYAKERGYSGVVGHGLLTTCFFSRMAGVYLPGKNSLLMGVDVSYLKPVFAGDNLEFEATVTSVDIELKFIDLKVTVINQKKEKVLRGKMRVGVYSEK